MGESIPRYLFGRLVCSPEDYCTGISVSASDGSSYRDLPIHDDFHGALDLAADFLDKIGRIRLFDSPEAAAQALQRMQSVDWDHANRQDWDWRKSEFNRTTKILEDIRPNLQDDSCSTFDELASTLANELDGNLSTKQGNSFLTSKIRFPSTSSFVDESEYASDWLQSDVETCKSFEPVYSLHVDHDFDTRPSLNIISQCLTERAEEVGILERAPMSRFGVTSARRCSALNGPGYRLSKLMLTASAQPLSCEQLPRRKIRIKRITPLIDTHVANRRKAVLYPLRLKHHAMGLGAPLLGVTSPRICCVVDIRHLSTHVGPP